MRVSPLSLLLAALLGAAWPASRAGAQDATPPPPSAPADKGAAAAQGQQDGADDADDQDDAPQTQEQREKSQEVAASDDPDAAESRATQVPLDEIRRFVGVFNAVRESYVDPVDDGKLMSSAIRGLLLDLDPHSAYLQKDDAKEFDEETSGAYDGIGVDVLQQPDGSIKIVSAIDDTPARRAGLRTGDLIIAVDGKLLAPGDADAPLRGKPGTPVTLTIQREGAAKPFEVKLVRETIRLASVKGRMLEPGYGYIRLTQFQADTAADFEKALARLQGESGGRLKGLVLDLRSNPGGLLTSAVQIADDLLDSGTIVTTKGRVAISDAQFNATPGDRMGGAPVVVIVDAGSASAAEVLAGALHDNHRVTIIGSRTFGKGSVQTVLPLDNGDAIKLTTARYYTPSGKSIQASGIQPDIVLQGDKPPTLVSAGVDYSEAALPGHLHGDDEGADGAKAGDVLDGDAPIAAALAQLKKQVTGVAPPPAKPAAPASPPKPAAPTTTTPATPTAPAVAAPAKMPAAAPPADGKP